jgi:hypothetical protein
LKLVLFALLFTCTSILAQESDLLESQDIDALLDEIQTEEDVLKSETGDAQSLKQDAKLSDELKELDNDTTSLSEEQLADDADDLESLKEDLGDITYEEQKPEDMTIESFDEETQTSKENIETAEKKEEKKEVKQEKQETLVEIVNEDDGSVKTPLVFDIGQEEKELLEMAKYVQAKTTDKEWDEIASVSKMSSYTIVEGDWLWKISERLFGSGFYYPKIWALNPYITNPHEIEPGMTLVFTTGSDENMPEIRFGSFTETDKNQSKDGLAQKTSVLDYSKYGDGSAPEWFKTKKELLNQGVYVQYSTEDTVSDIRQLSDKGLIEEYKKYDPPIEDIEVTIPDADYDSSGFDRNARIEFPFKEGFYLNTFLSTNIIQDFGSIDASVKEGVFLSRGDNVYLKFDSSMNVIAGDKYSIYRADGKVSHKSSERTGYKYTIVAQVQTIAQKDDLWLAEIVESSGVAMRGDRITVYTPKIQRIVKTFNDQIIEAAIIGSFTDFQSTFSFGDVLYLDRGRADGVEVGNVFEVYGFKDRLTNKNITNNPTYKTAELTMLMVTDNFSTALVTQSAYDFYRGDIGVTKTKEAAAKAAKLKMMLKDRKGDKLRVTDLEELDVELNIDEMTDELLNKADQIQFTEDELAELERQEREKSILKESERDLRSLEKLESDIEQAETLLNEAKVDQDKKLEQLKP